MERFGFIHDKLDLKILILFILRRLPAAIDREALSELVMQDEGVGYFDYTECLAELADTGHVELMEDGYRITEKGDRNGFTIESSLPYTVRTRVERAITPIVNAMNRNAMIKTEHSLHADGGCQVELAMGDGIGEIISLRLLAANEEQAMAMEKKFRAEAETFYNRIVEMLSE